MSEQTSNAKTFFKRAKPIWPEGRETEKNLFVGFRAVFEGKVSTQTVLKIAASSLYRCWLNGRFLGHGPARGPHGFFRVDEWNLEPYMVIGSNLLAIEVAGYNVNSYYILDQPSFLQAEIVAEDQILVASAEDGVPFEAILLNERVQKVQRYSFQRPFIEVYQLKPGYTDWRRNLSAKIKKEKCAHLSDKRLLQRGVSLPDFRLLQPVKYVSKGQVQRNMEPQKFWKDETLIMMGPKLGGFKEEELSKVHSNYLQTITNTNIQQLNKPYQPNSTQKLLPDSLHIIDFGQNLTGFIGAKIKTKQSLHLYITFDEILSDNDVNFTRLGCVNLIYYELSPGEYEVETFEPYTLRYLKLLALDGECTVENLYLRELACPDSYNAYFSCSDHRINDLFKAARETFRQNSIDIFMDCPSRERAGWLCDSYFTARVENDLCGNNKIERNFFENFLLPDSFANIPEGMLPMCYPADHYDGVFIPNWALWFVIQLEEYLIRSGDQTLVNALRSKVLKLFEYFKNFQNEDGLLEKLDSWIFVEWSKANEFVQDVNYPTNMLYSAALDAAGRIYSETKLNSEATRLRQTIHRQSFNGEFFVDNALRQNGKLVLTTNRTETCQYYAFYFNVASPDTHSELWDKLVTEFGPHRKEKGLYPEIHPSNALNGNFLRMELLSRYGRNRQLLSELKDYFLYMADRTGTLWENIDVRASCNHGFASHIAHILFRDILGIKLIDIQNNKIIVQLCDLPLEWCEGRIPIGKNTIFFKWWIEDQKIYYRVHIPAGFVLTVENHSNNEIVQYQ